MFNSAIAALLADPRKRITVLTGSGISAESGIPTFRGPEGYWTVGSKVYMPQEIATLAMFRGNPREVWEWYLYRLGVCLHAQPNAGHEALAQMERALGARFNLITQNIDNLHLRAGNTRQRTFEIHGNINYTRCAEECSGELQPLDERLKVQRTGRELSAAELELLRCARCGNWLRPHVLWFDEYYDEEYFHFNSSIAVAGSTDLLIVVGTSASTTLPNQVVQIVHGNGKTIIDINIEPNPFSELAATSRDGMFLKAPAASVLPQLAGMCPEP